MSESQESNERTSCVQHLMPRQPGRPLCKSELAQAIREIGIIASVRVPDEHQLLPVGKALLDGGVRAVQLAYTSIGSGASLIHELKEGGLLIGIGALTRSAQARQARAIGADFITASATTPDSAKHRVVSRRGR